MKKTFLVETAQLMCDKGSGFSALKVTSQTSSLVGNKLQATEADKTPNVNIFPFGICAITRKRCQPAPIGWHDRIEWKKLDGLASITNKSNLRCSLGGVIKCVEAGQSFYGIEDNERQKDSRKKNKVIEIKVIKSELLPLGILDFAGKKENNNIRFRIIAREGSFSGLFLRIYHKGVELYSESIQKNLVEGEEHIVLWDGFSSKKIYDSRTFVDGDLIATITDGSISSKIEINSSYKRVDWVDVKIDNNIKEVYLTLRVKFREKKIQQGATLTFADLVSLALEGIKLYWGRNKSRTIGNSITIEGTEFQVFIKPINTQEKAMPQLDVSAYVFPEVGWSRNWGYGPFEFRELFFNEGLSYRYYLAGGAQYPGKYWQISEEAGRTKDKQIYLHTSAHEVGHEILAVFGGDCDYSYTHKGTSGPSCIIQAPIEGSKLPKSLSDEIDLMKYYFVEKEKEIDNYIDGFEFNNFYGRSVAHAKDVLGLIWCSKLVVK